MERSYLNKRSSHSTKNTCSTKYLFISNTKWFYFFHLKVSYRIVRRSTKLFEYPRELLHLFVFHSEEKNPQSLNCFHSVLSFEASSLNCVFLFKMFVLCLLALPLFIWNILNIFLSPIFQPRFFPRI
jgi:hypothetical protein